MEDRTPSGLLDIDNEDDNALRVIVIVPWELPGTWEGWRDLFPGRGPVRISVAERPIVFDGASRRLREPVRRRLLDPGHRRHYVYDAISPVFVSAKNRASRGGAPFFAFAWDVLEVEAVGALDAGGAAPGGREGATRVLIALHLVLSEPTSPNAFSWVRNLTRRSSGKDELAYEVARVLSRLSGRGPTTWGTASGSPAGTGTRPPIRISSPTFRGIRWPRSAETGSFWTTSTCARSRNGRMAARRGRSGTPSGRVRTRSPMSARW